MEALRRLFVRLVAVAAASSSLSLAAVTARPGSTADDIRNVPVVRQGSQLLLNGQPWKAVGPNVYWLGLDENVTPPSGQPYDPATKASYPTKGRVSEAMAMVRAMGGTAIRAHTLGVSTGNPLSVWPAAHKLNADAFEAIDWAVYQARVYGLRLLVPLTDNYDYYHGGKYNFLRWGGLDLTRARDENSPQVAQFYTNSAVVTIFHDYIRTLLTHVNRYTNMTYAADPTIWAYETGNELDTGVTPDWLRSTGQLIKQLAPNKLVVDGTYGIVRSHLSLGSGASPAIDVVSDHYYPVSLSKLRSDLSQVASANLTYLAGEYSWTGASPAGSGDGSLVPFFHALETSSGVAGDMFWSLFGHNVPDCKTFVSHSDGLALQYGNPANSADTNSRIQLIRQHFEKAGQNTNVAANAALPAVACPAPDSPSALASSTGTSRRRWWRQ